MGSETISSASLCRWENAAWEVRSDEGHGVVVTSGKRKRARLSERTPGASTHA